jgi:outer membrane lipoprotein carrier protein
MSPRLLLALLLLALSAPLGAAPPTPPPAPAATPVTAAVAPAPTLEQAAAGIEKRYAEGGDFKARFTQETRQASVKDLVLKKKGQVFFKRPGLMRWDYTEPDQVYYISDGQTLWNYIPESALVYKMPVKGSRLTYALQFLFGTGKMATEFGLGACPPMEGLSCLKLSPKKADHAFKEIRLYHDQAFAIAATALVDPEGGESLLRFVSPTFGPLDGAGFRFTPPADARVEDLGQESK